MTRQSPIRPSIIKANARYTKAPSNGDDVEMHVTVFDSDDNGDAPDLCSSSDDDSQDDDDELPRYSPPIFDDTTVMSTHMSPMKHGLTRLMMAKQY